MQRLSINLSFARTVVAFAVLLVAAQSQRLPGPLPPPIGLPNGFRSTSVVRGPNNSFFVGSWATGSVFQLSFSGQTISSIARQGRAATDLAYDKNNDLIFAAGNQHAKIWVYRGSTGDDVQEIDVAPWCPAAAGPGPLQPCAFRNVGLTPSAILAIDIANGRMVVFPRSPAGTAAGLPEQIEVHSFAFGVMQKGTVSQPLNNNKVIVIDQGQELYGISEGLSTIADFNMQVDPIRVLNADGSPINGTAVLGSLIVDRTGFFIRTDGLHKYSFSSCFDEARVLRVFPLSALFKDPVDAVLDESRQILWVLNAHTSQCPETVANQGPTACSTIPFELIPVAA